MLDLGMVRPGTTLHLPFNTFDSNDPSASVTITGLAVTDIEIYKDGGTTQRASDAGYTLLDTDGIDFDGVTGIHGLSIDLADNTTAGFYEAGSQYWVVIASITIDGATVNFVVATFRIGYPNALLNTTVATLASQTSFTLEEGPADDDALNGWVAVIHDLASAVQIAQGFVSDYVGSTRTVTLGVDPGIFTMAAGDNVSFFLRTDVGAVSSNQAAADNLDTAGANYSATRGLSGTAIPAAAADAAGGLPISDGGGLDLDARIQTDLAAILVDVTGLNGDAMRGTDSAALASVATAARLAELDPANLPADLDAVLADTNELQGDWVDGGRLDLLLDDAREALVIRRNTAQAGAATSITLDTGASSVDDFYNDTYVVLVSGTGVGQARFVSDYVGSTRVATVNAAWITNPDATSVFLVVAFSSLPGATAPTAAAVADAVWDEANADHVGAGSTGERVERLDLLASGGAGGLTNARAVNLDNLDAAVSTRAAAAVLGALADAAADGDPTATDTLVAYAKQLINVLVGTTGVTTFPVAVAPADNVSLAEIIRAIYDDTNLIGTPAGASLAADLVVIDNFVDGVEADIAALNDLSAAGVNAEVVDALSTDTYAEPAGVPAATATLATKLGYLHMVMRNRLDVTATKMTFFDDGGAAEWEKNLTDDATTYSESEANAI